MEAVFSSETKNIYQTIRLHVPKDSNPEESLIGKL
jgi:hypothetical protein